MNLFTIYKITNDTNDMVYVGSTKGRVGRDPLKNRMNAHKSSARNGCTTSMPTYIREHPEIEFTINAIKQIICPKRVAEIHELIEFWNVPNKFRINKFRPFTHNSEQTRCIVKKRITRKTFYHKHMADPEWAQKERDRNRIRMRERRARLKKEKEAPSETER
jgi:hypothetical protein